MLCAVVRRRLCLTDEDGTVKKENPSLSGQKSLKKSALFHSMRALNQAIKRNKERFPEDFAFRLTENEKHEVVANCDHLSNLKYSKALPRAFTEHGAIMAASVLNLPRAVKISVYVVRAFVKLRQALTEHTEIARKLAEIENRLPSHDEQILSLIQAIRQLAAPKPPPPQRRIGFHPDRP